MIVTWRMMASPCFGAASTGDAAASRARAKTASRGFIGATFRIDHPLASSRAGSSDPDTLIPMPCLDRFFGIEIEYRVVGPDDGFNPPRSEEHTSELQSLIRTSYAVFCFKKKHTDTQTQQSST